MGARGWVVVPLRLMVMLGLLGSKSAEKAHSSSIYIHQCLSHVRRLRKLRIESGAPSYYGKLLPGINLGQETLLSSRRRTLFTDLMSPRIECVSDSQRYGSGVKASRRVTSCSMALA
jgi:hypothetical protein